MDCAFTRRSDANAFDLSAYPASRSAEMPNPQESKHAPMSDPARIAITTRDLKLWYGKFQALMGVSMDIKHGQITSLIGPSGCGKTTLLRCFNRINERYGNVTTTGEVRVLGTDIYGPQISLLELRQRVGMVFQRPNPLPISIYENVVFGLRAHSARGTLKRSNLNQ